MVTRPQLRIILDNLLKILEEKVDGDVVEMGCNVGTTSLFLARVIQNTDKKLYVYDSFDGLPKNSINDSLLYKKGQLKCSEKELTKNFDNSNLPLPKITKGWFKDISDSKFPDKISFAFFDGDFYESILDSFNKIYDKLSVGGVICVHDYGYPPLPGVSLACHKFLENKKVDTGVGQYILVIKKLCK